MIPPGSVLGAAEIRAIPDLLETRYAAFTRRDEAIQ